MRDFTPHSNGVRFYHHGHVIGRYQDDTQPLRVGTQSCTKSLVGVAIFKARDLGLLSLDDHIVDYLPKWSHLKGYGYEGITIRHLLTHTSGLPGNDFFQPKDESRYLSGDEQFHNHLAATHGRNERASMHIRQYKVGSRFDYSNPGMQLLEGVLSSALARAGRSPSVNDFMQNEIFTPLGMNDTSLTKEGDVVMFNGGMGSTAEDLLNLGLFILNEGRGTSAEVLSPESMREMLGPSYLLAASADYGHLWWRKPVYGVVAAIGDLQNLVFVLPEEQIVITRTAPVPPAFDRDEQKQIAEAFWAQWHEALRDFRRAVPMNSRL